MIKLEPLVKDGARYPCGFTTFFGQLWDCPRDAEGFLPEEEFILLQGVYEDHPTIKIRHRAVCGLHQETYSDEMGY